MECIEKVCPRCQVRKHARSYGVHSHSHDRLQPHCLDCQSQMATMRAKQRRIASIWTDGPDSEAARAYRGEGTRAGCSQSVAECFARENLRLLRLLRLHGIPVEPGAAPDPAHTPAARRVVAWKVAPSLFEDLGVAYRAAARAKMETAPSAQRFSDRLHAMPGERVDGLARGAWRYHDRVRDRLARLLRHWDEKAGWR